MKLLYKFPIIITAIFIITIIIISYHHEGVAV